MGNIAILAKSTPQVIYNWIQNTSKVSNFGTVLLPSQRSGPCSKSRPTIFQHLPSCPRVFHENFMPITITSGA